MSVNAVLGEEVGEEGGEEGDDALKRERFLHRDEAE